MHAWSITPTSASIASHSSRRLDERDPLPGYGGGMCAAADYPPGQMLGWTPGQRPRLAPDGTQWAIDPGSDLVVQLHLQPTGKPEAVQVSVGLFFTDAPPTRTPVGVRLGSERIDIAAGDSSYVVSDSYTLPVDVELLAIQPHAHNLARRMSVAATLPDGTKQSLIAIADWDFRWQEIYRYARRSSCRRARPCDALHLRQLRRQRAQSASASGTRRLGAEHGDEMGDLWLQVIPKSSATCRRWPSTSRAGCARKTWPRTWCC